jgi:hypothetical protein
MPFPAHKRSSAQTAQSALVSVSVVLPIFRNERNKVKENSNGDWLDETVHENTSAVVGHASVTNRIRVQDVIDSYQISQARLKAQYPRWSMIGSDAQMPGFDASVANGVRTLAAESEISGMFRGLKSVTENNGGKFESEKERD